MNTSNDTLHFDSVRMARVAEVGIYAGLAAVLIGQIFSHQGSITPLDASLIWLGIFFGLIASCGGAPLSSLFARSTLRRDSSGEPLQRSSGEVRVFSPRQSSQQAEAAQSDGTSRRAA